VSFWDRRIAEIKGTPRGSTAPGRPPQPPPAGEPPAWIRDSLAVRPAVPAGDPLAQRIRREGYIRRPPLWVQRQPHDTCPNCGSVDLAAVSNGGYSAPGAPGTILRCFDCNWSSGRGVSALWGIPPSGPVAGRAVQSRDGTVRLRNTGLIPA
jgi:hypothetical protein